MLIVYSLASPLVYPFVSPLVYPFVSPLVYPPARPKSLTFAYVKLMQSYHSDLTFTHNTKKRLLLSNSL